MHAVYKGHTETAQLLIEAGADKDPMSNVREAVIVQTPHTVVVELLRI